MQNIPISMNIYSMSDGTATDQDWTQLKQSNDIVLNILGSLIKNKFY